MGENEQRGAVARIIALAKVAKIDCDDVPVEPQNGAFVASLRRRGADVVVLDSELGLTEKQALERLEHIVDAHARARMKLARVECGRLRAGEAPLRAQVRSAREMRDAANASLQALDPSTAQQREIDARLTACTDAARILAACERAAHAATKKADRAFEAWSAIAEAFADATAIGRVSPRAATG